MAQHVMEGGGGLRFTTSTVVRAGPVQLLGIWVSNASSSPTIELLNAVTSGTGTLVGQFTPVGGTFNPLPINFPTGLTLLCGGSVSGTMVFASDGL